MGKNSIPSGGFPNCWAFLRTRCATMKNRGIARTRRTCNHYRYFTDTDCRGLMMSRMLRSLGFPLKEVCTMLKEGGPPPLCYRHGAAAFGRSPALCRRWNWAQPIWPPRRAAAEAAEQAGLSQPAVEILSTGEGTSYRIAGSGQNVALRLEKPGSATTFEQALIQSVTVDGREVAGIQAPVAEPGDAILYVASRVKGAKEM